MIVIPVPAGYLISPKHALKCNVPMLPLTHIWPSRDLDLWLFMSYNSPSIIILAHKEFTVCINPDCILTIIVSLVTLTLDFQNTKITVLKVSLTVSLKGIGCTRYRVGSSLMAISLLLKYATMCSAPDMTLKEFCLILVLSRHWSLKTDLFFPVVIISPNISGTFIIDLRTRNECTE